MAEPFTDFVVPPLLHSAVLLVGTGIIVALLATVRPPVTERTVVAFVPWMVVGGTLHVFYQLGVIFQVELYPSEIEPLFSAPAVYLTTFIAMGVVWVASGTVVPPNQLDRRVPRYLGSIGVGVAIPLILLVIWQGLDEAVAPMEPVWPVVGLLVSMVLTAVVYFLIGTWRTYIIARARYAGAFVVFAHVFDAVTTTIGVDVMGAGERSAVPRAILDFAADLPTAETLGTGWLFILLKIFLASAIVIYFADGLKENETETNLLFAFVIALGLGPGVHNFFLFLLSP